MLTIETFVFNPFQVNNYLIYNELNECIIIDAACQKKPEQDELVSFIENHGLKPVKLLTTHCHIDHIMGNNFIFSKYGLKPVIHQRGSMFLGSAREHAWGFGFQMEDVVLPEEFIEDGDKIPFGSTEFEVVYTPGHANGSVCFINHLMKVVFTGDVLFNSSIGRTDLPTGNYETLVESIHNKLFTLPDDYVVYPGHGETTTIGYERKYNPFVGNL